MKLFRLIPSTAIACSLCALGTVQSAGQEPAAAPYGAALRALDRGLPEVAIEKLQHYLAGPISDAERGAAQIRLADAMIQAGRFDDALQRLAPIPPEQGEAVFLSAEALSGAGRWTEALAHFEELLASGSSSAAVQPAPWATLFAPACRLGAARALQALGRDDEAIRVLEEAMRPVLSLSGSAAGTSPAASEPVLALTLAALYAETNRIDQSRALLKTFHAETPGEERWQHYIEARNLLAQDQAAPALFQFQALLKDPRGLTEGLLAGIALGMTDCRAVLNGLDVADNVCEDFIWQHANSPYLELIFKKLDETYTAEENPSDSELAKLAQAAPPRRAALAQYYFISSQIRQKKREKALRSIDGFLQSYPGHPLTANVLLTQGKLLMAEAKDQTAGLRAFETAMRATNDPELRAEIEASAGLAYFRRGEYLLAANFFRTAADHSARLRQAALFNSALSWLHQKNYDRFLVDYKELSSRFPESEIRRELILEEGLLQARSGDRRAESTLKLFLRDFPDHPRVTEARLALAELAFLASPRKRNAAAGYIRAAYDAPAEAGPKAAADAAERADYLSVFMADTAPDRTDAAVMDACRKFIAAYHRSQHLPEVRMKLGQMYYKEEDFPDAQTQFETLARENPESEYAEAALFLAGESSMKSMSAGGIDRALSIFEEMAQRDGPLKLYARQEQAVAKSRLGSTKEAIILYDSILSAKPTDSEQRFAALCGKGDCLLLLGANNAESIDAAIAVFNQLGDDPEVTPAWRNQALYKKGKCLQQLKKEDAALAVYYDVVESQNSSAGRPEYFWYYKAGFDAAAILESHQNWKSAIAMYQQMARLQGPRADEAKGRANQIRLERFIWED